MYRRFALLWKTRLWGWNERIRNRGVCDNGGYLCVLLVRDEEDRRACDCVCLCNGIGVLKKLQIPLSAVCLHRRALVCNLQGFLIRNYYFTVIWSQIELLSRNASQWKSFANKKNIKITRKWNVMSQSAIPSWIWLIQSISAACLH